MTPILLKDVVKPSRRKIRSKKKAMIRDLIDLGILSKERYEKQHYGGGEGLRNTFRVQIHHIKLMLLPGWDIRPHPASKGYILLRTQ